MSHKERRYQQQNSRRSFRAKEQLKNEADRRKTQGLFHNQQQKKTTEYDSELLYMYSKLGFDFRKPTHCAIFLGLGFCLLPAVSAMEEKEIRALVRQKMILDEDVTPRGCQPIIDNIAKAATQPDFNNQPILDTLKQPEFNIICTDRKHNPNGLAFYSAGRKSMVFFAKEPTRPATARHEFYHANHHLESAHGNGNCIGTNEQMLAPIYPYTDDEIASYHAAFARGDKKLNTFINQINLPREKWTAKQVRIYETYSQAFSKCIPIQVDIPITKSFFKALESNHLPLLNNNYVNTPCTSILSVFKSADNHMATLEISTVEDFAKFVRWNINILLTSQDYKTYSKYIKIAEREAHTLQFITKEVVELVYPEVNKKYYEYQSRCADSISEKKPSAKEL